MLQARPLDATDFLPPSVTEDPAATIARLEAKIAAQNILICEQADALAHSRKIFDRASAAARIGVWECSLPTLTLRWTDVVYDLFDLPRGSKLSRDEILTYYRGDSRLKMERLRERAIAERGGFTFDAEIETPRGAHRWIRITATAEWEGDTPARIFGMKQDITEEKTLADRTRYLAENDPVTGLANRARFQERFAELAGRRKGDVGSLKALLLLDLDGFKQVNDIFGHAAGDECLREAGLRLQSACPDAELVARVGGDEFAVLLGPSFTRARSEKIARKIVERMRGPVVFCDDAFHLSASVGVAIADGSAPTELFMQADAALYAAKAAGRDTTRTFNHALRGGPVSTRGLPPAASPFKIRD